VRKHLVEAGFDPTDSEVRRITKRVKEYGSGKRQVTAGDVERFAEEADIDREEEEGPDLMAASLKGSPPSDRRRTRRQGAITLPDPPSGTGPRVPPDTGIYTGRIGGGAEMRRHTTIPTTAAVAGAVAPIIVGV